MKVSGKVVVVTGAGSGMGRELTIQLVGRGSKVAAVDMRPETLAETMTLATKSGGAVETFLLDISDLSAVANLPNLVEAKLGPVDALINNAGIIQPFVKINDLTFEQADRVMKVNFYGPFALLKAFIPGLLNRPEAHILNVSSMGAYTPVPGQSLYGASKAAIKLLTEGLTSELAGTNVGVTVVFPGAIATNIAANSGMNMTLGASAKAPKMTSASVAAKAMIDAIESKKPRLCIGKDAKMMDILTRINPVYAAKVIRKQMASLLS